MLTEVKRFLVSEASSAGGWNFAETFFLAALFVAAAYIIPRAIEKTAIEFDRDFFQITTAYAFLIAALAAIISPVTGTVIGVTTAALSLLVSYKSSSMTGFEELTFYRYFGLATAVATLPLLDHSATFISAAVFLPFAGAAVALSRFLKAAPVYAVAGQYFDAATSFAVLSAGGTELHILGGYFVELLGPQGIFFMKTVIVLPATLHLYRVSRDDRRLYYMFIIGFLGLALGLANLFRA